MTVVSMHTGEVVEFDRAAAERRAERITLRLDAIADNYRAVLPMIREAIEKRDDLALGYRSPGDYVSDRFGQSLAGLGIEVRRAVVGELTQAGLSTRAIAPVVGVHHDTVARDARRVVCTTPLRNEAPRSTDTDREVFSAEHLTTAPAPTIPPGEPVCRDVGAGSMRPVDQVAEGAAPSRPPVVGIDGKTYMPKEPAKPKRRPLPDAFWTAVYDLGKRAESLHRLIEDDRFPQNAEKVAANHRNDLFRINDLLQQVINSLPDTESTHE